MKKKLADHQLALCKSKKLSGMILNKIAIKTGEFIRELFPSL